MNFIAVDYFFALLILVFAICGAIKGFVSNLFGKLALILGLLAAFFFYEDLALVFDTNHTGGILYKILSFLVLFIFVFLIVKIIDILVSKIFTFAILKSLDRTLGFFLGIIEGGLISGFIILILINQPFFDANPYLEGSFFYGIYTSVINNPSIKELTENV